MPAALSLNPHPGPHAPPGQVQARLGFAGSELRVRGRVASLACAYAPHGTTIELTITTRPDRAGHRYALLSASGFVMVGAGPDLDMHWGNASPTTLRLAVRLDAGATASNGADSRLSVELPA